MSDPVISHGMTAFLDILGFGNRVLKAGSATDLAPIIEDVRRIHRAFEFTDRDELTNRAHAITNKTVLAFSDSVIVNIPLESDITRTQGTFDAFMGELLDLALSQCLCIEEGLFLRGGLDLGWWHRDGDILVSQGLARAYRMEGIANVPVIALTDDLFRYLSEHRDRLNYASDIDPMRSMLRKYEGSDANGDRLEFWFVDYITIVVRNLAWQPSARRQEYLDASPERRDEMHRLGDAAIRKSWFAKHARTIEQAHGRAGSSRVAAKFAWLAAYHNDIAQEFGQCDECRCEVLET